MTPFTKEQSIENIIGRMSQIERDIYGKLKVVKASQLITAHESDPNWIEKLLTIHLESSDIFFDEYRPLSEENALRLYLGHHYSELNLKGIAKRLAAYSIEQCNIPGLRNSNAQRYFISLYHLGNSTVIPNSEEIVPGKVIQLSDFDPQK